MIARIALVNNVLVKNVAVNDTFGESGTPFELIKKYGLDSDSIVESVKKVISRKK